MSITMIVQNWEQVKGNNIYKTCYKTRWNVRVMTWHGINTFNFFTLVFVYIYNYNFYNMDHFVHNSCVLECVLHTMLSVSLESPGRSDEALYCCK